MNTAYLEGLAATLCFGLEHALWQAGLVALGYWVVGRAFGLGPVGRHRLGTLGMLLLPIALVLTMSRRGFPSPSQGLPFVAAAARAPSADTGLGNTAAISAATPDPWLGHGEIMVAGMWVLVVCVLCIRGLLLLRHDQRNLALAEQLAPHWLTRCEALARAAGAPARLRFVALAGAGVVPYTMGVLRPVVVLPLAMLANLPQESVEAILRHEIGHVVRRHYLLNLLQSCTEIIFFFHPAVWWLGREVRRERELCCDLDALAGGESPVGYARALLKLEELRAQPVPGLSALGSGLLPRIERIVSMKTHETNGKALPRGAVRSRRRAAFGWGASLIVAGLCAAGIAACSEAVGGEHGPGDSAQASAELTIRWLPPDVRRHQELIIAEAERSGVDANLLALMVLAESAGDPNAKSPGGARGLMQLMPATARAVSARAEIPLTDDEQLFDPALNLRLGAQLVKELSKHFADRPAEERRRLGWSAYNAGSAAVARHLEHGDALPEETQKYVQFLDELYAERDQPESPRYQAWRKRSLERRLASAQRPAEGARVLTGFGPRHAEPTAGHDPHAGVDLLLPAGSGVSAVLDGTVSEAGPAPDGFGMVVTLRHGSGLTTRYSHLGSIAVKLGDEVKRGAQLGAPAEAGPHGPHMHFEVRDQGAPMDPKPLLGQAD